MAVGIPDIDEVNQAIDGAPEPADLFFLPIPMPVYKALSDAAARRNLTVAQLIAEGLGHAIRGVGDGNTR
jgi:hypothetical protein